jgi:hypothetical protein
MEHTKHFLGLSSHFNAMSPVLLPVAIAELRHCPACYKKMSEVVLQMVCLISVCQLGFVK